MLSCLTRCNYCIESQFPASINRNPLYLRWLREQRSNKVPAVAAQHLIQHPAALAAPVSLEYNSENNNNRQGKEATPISSTNQVALAVSVAGRQERGERRFDDRRFPGMYLNHI